MKASRLSLLALLALVACVARGSYVRGLSEELEEKDEFFLADEDEGEQIVNEIDDEAFVNSSSDDDELDVEADPELGDDGDDDRRLAGGKGYHELYLDNLCHKYRSLTVKLKWLWRRSERKRTIRARYGYRYYVGYTDTRNIRWKLSGDRRYRKARMPRGKKGTYYLKLTC